MSAAPEDDRSDRGNPSRAVREEDSLDVRAVAQWLGRGDITQVRQFAGGASNLTYLLRYDAGPDLILRRPPVGAKARGAHDMGREHTVQRALAPVFPYVPTMVGPCSDESVIGSEFYVMEKLEGLIPRKDLDAVPELAALGRGDGYVRRQVAGWAQRFAEARTDDTAEWSDVAAWLTARQPCDVAQRLVQNDFRLDIAEAA